MKTILLIDDHSPLRANLAEILETEGYQVLAAADGHTGLLIATEIKPALIICDIMLPRLNGYEFFSKIRMNPDTAKIPFIFMSARHDTRFTENNMKEKSFLLKPFDQTALIKMVKTKLLEHEKSNHQTNYTSIDHIQALENILNIISHEMRNPICSSLGLSGLLDHKADTGKMSEEIHTIVKGINANARKLNEITISLTDIIYTAINNYKAIGLNKE